MEHDSLSLGPWPFVAAPESATGIHAETVGKPGRAFFETVIASFGFDDKADHEGGRIVIIGDDIETDLGGAAVELGLWRVLGASCSFCLSCRSDFVVMLRMIVKTGKYRPGDEQRPGVVPPDEVCDSFAAFVDSLLKDQA